VNNLTPVPAGVHQMPDDRYHADPCQEPSLSASIAKILWHKTPLHAWHAHPRLNPEHEPINKTAFDLGTACHAVLLEGDMSKIVHVEASDWRTKAAQAERELAYCAGLTPMLPKQIDQVKRMADAAFEFIARSQLAGLFDDGLPEQTLIAQYQGVWLRGRTDWMTADRKIIVDYKTVGQGADIETFGRAIFTQGHDIQAAMYGLLNGLTGGPPETSFIWLVQEVAPPHVCRLIGASGAVDEMGEHKLMRSIGIWKDCLSSGVWPGYSTRIEYPDPPPWELAKLEQRMQEDAG